MRTKIGLHRFPVQLIFIIIIKNIFFHKMITNLNIVVLLLIIAQALFLVVCVSDVQRNNAWPEKLKWEVPDTINAMVWYPRVRQYWHMFAPRPIRTIRTIAVEAETIDGRIVDLKGALEAARRLLSGKVRD